MGLEVSGHILDNMFEHHSQVVQQTCNHSLHMSLSVVACHEALLLPQILVVTWRAEIPSGEPPVHVHTVQIICVIILATEKN